MRGAVQFTGGEYYVIELGITPEVSQFETEAEARTDVFSITCGEVLTL